MNKKIGVILLFLLFFYTVSAEMTISETKEIYNIGDKLYVTLNGIVGSPQGNLNIDLVCKNATVNLLKISARAFSTDAGQSYSLPFKILNEEDLELNNISSIVGKCWVVASLNENSVKTSTFEITNSLNMKSMLNKLTYSPGEIIALDISATNANGEKINAKYQVANFTTLSGDLISGNANTSIQLSDSQKAGTYALVINVFDLDSNGDIMNFCSEIEYIVVSQRATSIDLGISEVELLPDEELTINPELFDQSGEKMDGIISIYLQSPTNELRTYSFDVGEYSDISFYSNDSVGVWTLYAFSGSVYSQKYEISLGCLPKLSYDIVGGLLTVENVGNCLYSDSLNISLGETNYSFNLTLKPQTKKQFNLQAPDGDYDVSILTGNDSFTGKTFLTGNAVFVQGVGDKQNNLDVLWIVLFVLVILGSLVFVITKNSKNNTNKNPKKLSPSLFNKIFRFKNNNSVKKVKTEEFISTGIDKEITAESTLVLNGEKMKSVIVTINVKNNKELSEETKKNLVNMIKDSSNKITLDIKDDYYFLIFSPLITKTYQNDMIAVQAALKLVKELVAYNKKYATKIKFGISVHSGDLIAEKDKNMLKYTGVFDTLPISKKIASMSNEKLLVSDNIRKKLLRDLNVIKECTIGDLDVYNVCGIKNIEENKAKLDDILKRMN